MDPYGSVLRMKNLQPHDDDDGVGGGWPAAEASDGSVGILLADEKLADEKLADEKAASSQQPAGQQASSQQPA